MNKIKTETISFFATRNSGGGASRIVRQLSNGLHKNKIKVDVNYLAEKTLSNKSSWPEINKGVTVNCSGKKRSVTSIPWIIKKHRDRKDPIICFGRTAAVTLVIASLFFKHERDIYIWEGKSLSDAQKGAKDIIGKFILPLLIKFSYKKAKTLIGISNEEIDDFKNYLSIDESKLKKIYTPAITKEHHDKIFEPLPTWFKKTTEGKVVITAAGSFLPQKNFPLLLSAFAKLNESKGNLQLILMGDGPDKESLIELAKSLKITENVLFTGYVDNPLPIIAAGDCFVLSSSWEGLPGVLIEAVFCQTRIVATNCPSGPFEILDGGSYGKLANVNDPIDLSEKISQALNSPIPEGLRKRSNLFSEEVIIEQYLEMLS
ncbi:MULTISPECIES: glycosyltransferase [Vibrio]|uniref:glycosyltransferase n=1 Tax=Vibrio TaxID=662 RepID=UPI001880933E|nr:MULTISPECIES: glycosyltransferase [Vibrio]MBE8557268.1 glycosyltransferase [Vibrio sp. OPT24]MCQ8869371.1 glycosyltransferase [Vibrio splendidus]